MSVVVWPKTAWPKAWSGFEGAWRLSNYFFIRSGALSDSKKISAIVSRLLALVLQWRSCGGQ
jgi:hypothetical protein